MSQNMYTADNFTVDVIPGGFKKEVRDLCRVAITVGWTLHVKGMRMSLIAPKPNDNQTIGFSVSNRNDNVTALRRKIDKYANPLLAFADKDGRGVGGEKRIEDTAKRMLTQEHAAAARADQAVAEAKDRADKLLAEQATKAEAEALAKIVTQPKFEGAEEPLDLDNLDHEVRHEPPTAADRAARTIVRTGPMIARRAQGKGYESSAATEREWSDGTIEYVCAVPGCTEGKDGGPWFTENRLGVSSHRKVHLNRGEVEHFDQASVVLVDIPEYEPTTTKVYAPRDGRLRSLAVHLLAEMVKMGPDMTDSMKADALAAAALEWSHERSGSSSGLAEREPLTDSEVLNKIRGMLDNGLYQQQADEMAALRAEKEAAEASAIESATEAQAAREELSSLASLLEPYRAVEA